MFYILYKLYNSFYTFRYKIPTIFISQKTILQTKHEKFIFLGYGTREDDFAFIVLPAFRSENIPGYKLILSDKPHPLDSNSN